MEKKVVRIVTQECGGPDYERFDVYLLVDEDTPYEQIGQEITTMHECDYVEYVDKVNTEKDWEQYDIAWDDYLRKFVKEKLGYDVISNNKTVYVW